MTITAKENLVGAWAFLVGIIIAVIVGLISYLTGKTVDPVILGFLVILGFIVGYFVSEENVQTFLFASVSLVLISYAGIQTLVIRAAIIGLEINMIITAVLGAMQFLFIPATIVVAIKTVFSLAQR
jgi:hypothetical protein